MVSKSVGIIAFFLILAMFSIIGNASWATNNTFGWQNSSFVNTSYQINPNGSIVIFDLDNFNDGIINPTWNQTKTNSSCNITETNGNLTINVSVGNTECYVCATRTFKSVSAYVKTSTMAFLDNLDVSDAQSGDCGYYENHNRIDFWNGVIGIDLGITRDLEYHNFSIELNGTNLRVIYDGVIKYIMADISSVFTIVNFGATYIDPSLKGTTNYNYIRFIQRNSTITTGNSTHYTIFGSGRQGKNARITFTGAGTLDVYSSSDNYTYTLVQSGISNYTNTSDFSKETKNQTQYLRLVYYGTNTTSPEVINVEIFDEATSTNSTTPTISLINNGSIGTTWGIVNYTVNQSNALSHINYSTNPSLTGSIQTVNISTGISRSENRTGLTENTTYYYYYYSVFAYNASNTSLWTNSPIYNFTTQASTTFIIYPAEYPIALKNPMMGFAWSDSGNNPYETMDDYRVGWNELENNSSDGVDKIINWTNTHLLTYPQKNKKTIIRVMLECSSCDAPNTYWPADMTTRDYSSHQFKTRLRALIVKMAQAWDNDPRIAFVQTGLISDWGEQGADHLTTELQDIIGQSFTGNFTNKKWSVRYPTDFTSYKGGIYWDSFAHYDQEREVAQIRALGGGNRWKTTMIGGETAYDWGNYLIQPGADPDDSLSDPTHRTWIIDRIRDLHATELAWISDYNSSNATVSTGADLMQKAFGYRFIIQSVEYNRIVEPGGNLTVSFTVNNTGSAPFYYNWSVEASLLNSITKQMAWNNTFNGLDIRKWLPGDKWNYTTKKYDTPPITYNVQQTFKLPQSLPTGEYIIALAILDPAGNLPTVKFAIKNYYNGGRHPIGKIGVGVDVRDPEINNFDDPVKDNSLHYNLFPDTVINLHVTGVGKTWINFSWTNPSDPDFSHVILNLNGTFIAQVYAPQNLYNLTDLGPDTSYELGTRTVDTYGNENPMWKNIIVTTMPDITPPIVSSPSSNQSSLSTDTDNTPLWGETALLSVNVTDDVEVASVAVNLSGIGGPSDRVMTKIGGNVYSTTTNASAHTPPKLYNLTVNATDVSGNSNNGVVIQLRIVKNGDVDGNGIVDMLDANRLANNVSFPGDSRYILSSIYAADVTGDGKVCIMDTKRIADNVSFAGNLKYVLR